MHQTLPLLALVGLLATAPASAESSLPRQIVESYHTRVTHCSVDSANALRLALVLLATGTGERVAESYDGDVAGAPLLHVTFTVE